MHWASSLVGLDWKPSGRDRDGVDCWGLVVLAHSAHGLTLPLYSGVGVDDSERQEVAAIVANDASQWPWTRIVDRPVKEMDVLVFRRGGFESHFGVAIDARRFLHITEEIASHIASTDRWKSKLVAVYRHQGLFE